MNYELMVDAIDCPRVSWRCSCWWRWTSKLWSLTSRLPSHCSSWSPSRRSCSCATSIQTWAVLLRYSNIILHKPNIYDGVEPTDRQLLYFIATCCCVPYCKTFNETLQVWLGFPITFFLICIFLVLTPVVARPVELGVATTILVTGVPVYYICIYWKKKPACMQTAIGNELAHNSQNQCCMWCWVC